MIPITVWWIDKYGEGVIRIIEGFIGSAVSSMDDKRLNILVQFVETICKVCIFSSSNEFALKFAQYGTQLIQ